MNIASLCRPHARRAVTRVTDTPERAGHSPVHALAAARYLGELNMWGRSSVGSVCGVMERVGAPHA